MSNRAFLAASAAIFTLASLFHTGLLVPGYQDFGAAIPEAIIAAVLLVGLVLNYVWPAASRGITLAAAGFALLGTLVGATLIAMGIGPRTVSDVVIHVVMLAVLVVGLLSTARTGPVAS